MSPIEARDYSGVRNAGDRGGGSCLNPPRTSVDVLSTEGFLEDVRADDVGRGRGCRIGDWNNPSGSSSVGIDDSVIDDHSGSTRGWKPDVDFTSLTGCGTVAILPCARFAASAEKKYFNCFSFWQKLYNSSLSSAAARKTFCESTSEGCEARLSPIPMADGIGDSRGDIRSSVEARGLL